MSPSMTPDDRDALSALFDGELHGDAARFAVRRLEHDAGWREACSRWQLTGDILRGQMAGLAPAGFAQRVSMALAAEAAAEVVNGDSGPRAPRTSALARSHRWWGRTALAASVAVAALFVAHPFSDPDTGSSVGVALDTPLAAAPAPDGLRNAGADPVASGVQPAAPAGGAEVAVVAAAVADVPRRVSGRRTRMGAPTTNDATPRQIEAPLTVALAAAEPTARPAATAAPDPFKPQAGELATRPWPRALLPGSSAAGAFTASYGTTQAAPSFYPFEPDPAHLPPAIAESAPQP